MTRFGLLISLLAVLSACSPNNNQTSQNQDQPVEFLSAKSGAFTGVSDFGTFEATATAAKLVTFSLKNNGDENLVGNIALDDSSAFKISYNNCPSSLGRNKSCLVKINFDPKVLAAGTYTANLSYDNVQVSLVAIKEAAEAVTGPKVQFAQGTDVISSLEFGNITEKQSITKTISVKNVTSLPVNEVVSISGGYVLSYDSCSNKSMSRNGSCSIKVSLSGAGKSGDVVGEISYAGATLALEANVTTVASGGGGAGSPTIVFLQNNNAISGTVDQGSISSSESKQVVLTLKNTGTLATTASTATSDNSNFQIVYNQCSNKSLAVNGTCQVRIFISGQNATVYGVQSSNITFAGASVQLSINILDPAGVITYEAVYSDYNSCSAIQACDGIGTKSRTILSCTKKQGNTVIGSDPAEACNAEFGTNENLIATCESPAGDVVSDILDLGIQAGSLTVTCSEGGMLPGTSRVVSCNSGFEQDGEQCIKLNTLQVAKTTPASGSISITGLDSPVNCDLVCSEINLQVRRDKTVNVSFTENESNQYAFNGFSGDNTNCLNNQCNLSLDSSKSLSISSQERKLVVLQETAGYNLIASGTGLLPTTAPSPTAGFTLAKAYYVANNTNVQVSVVVIGGTNVITGWYIDEVKQPAPVGSIISKSIIANTTIHATTGPLQQVCGNTAGDYFGVATGQGKQAWNATTGLYATRCIPNNSSSCISGSFDDHGSSNNYIYRTSTLFPNGDSQDPDPSYPYAQGACVKNSIYCGDSIPHSTNAFRMSFGGESQYQSCMFDCEGGYKVGNNACVAKKVYFSGGGTATGGVYNIQAYDFTTNSLTQVSSANANSGAFSAPTLYDVAASGNVYLTSVGRIYKNSTPIANLDNAQTDPSTMVAMEDNSKLFFNYNDFSQGMETFFTSTNNTSAVNPTVISYVAGTTAGQSTNAQIIPANGWLYIIGLNNTTHGLEWGRLNPTNNAIEAINTVSGGANGLDNATLTIANKPVLNDDYFMYYVGTNGSSGNEIMRISTLNPASPGTTLFAEVVAGATGSSPGLLTKWNSNIWFKATNGASTDLYYKAAGSSGTAATKLAGFSATSSGNIIDMAVFNNKLYVAANVNSSVGAELYVVTDNGGGSYSVTLVADINPGTGSSSPLRLVENGESLYFMATDANGLSFMRYNGTSVTNLSVTLGVQPANPSFNGGKHKMMVK